MLNINKVYFIHYLKLLGIPQREPSLAYLEEIIKAQLLKVSFENVSKLYYLKTSGLKSIPSFEQFLTGIEKYHFGGTCYANNYYLNLLLNFLGYDVKLCGADMSRPDVHIANIVTIESKEYIADTGYGAPFLAPMSRNLDRDYNIESGLDKYVLKPQDNHGRSRLELYRKGKVQHGYLLKPQARDIDEFNNSIAESFNPSATFMNAAVLTKFSQGCSNIIHNMSSIEIKGQDVNRKSFDTKEELIEAIEKIFGIPVNISESALTDISMNQGVWD
jgi:arylamine N-acetyltransferase